MKTGKKRITNSDPVESSPPPSSDLPTADAGDEDSLKTSADSWKRDDAEEPVEEDEADEEDSEGEREYEQDENVPIEEAGGERTKLADGFYELEAVRRKRVRKGQLQYLIKWRGWSEAANTWEPVENLSQCSDVIDAFEESLQTGKSRSARKRKRKAGVATIQTKKKLPHNHHQQQQQRSSTSANYNVPPRVIRIVEEPISFPSLNESSFTNGNDENNVSVTKSVETSKQVNENGGGTGSVTREEDHAQNELDMKLCELKGAMVVNSEDADRVAIASREVQQTGGDTLANGLKKMDIVDAVPVHLGRVTGAKKRKSGVVKRFIKDPVSCSVDGAPNGPPASAALIPINVQKSEFPVSIMSCKSKYEDSKSLCTIIEIVKPVSYKASISENDQEVLVAFEAIRADGTKLIVDNKFLKANNPLLLIDFYEKHLRYNPTSPK
ncbi:chromo domain protein LHP1-like [Salvia splendens]|uniref:chromo domain protein LHP1-like n=1 Tax=Salvia splendens TaxID=180675 RepID=UPI001C25C430|nr:chromo domain protein LHP1-like [Salvia splendens]